MGFCLTQGKVIKILDTKIFDLFWVFLLLGHSASVPIINLALRSYIKGLVKKLEAVGCLGQRPSPTFALGKRTVGHMTLGNVLVQCCKFVIFLFSFLQSEF